MDLNSQNWLDAQYSVLGSVLISPELAPKVISQMNDNDFSGHCLEVFRAIRTLFMENTPVDVISIRDKLGQDASPLLMRLMEITPTAANYQSYIDIARKQARTFRLRSIAQQMSESESPDEVQRLLDEAVALSSTKQQLRAVSMHEAMMDFVNRMIHEVPTYLHWPIKELDSQLFIEAGDLVVLGARPSVGKTAFALQCAWEMARTKRVGFFSLETSQKKITDRQAADLCSIPMQNIKRRMLTNEHQEAIIDVTKKEAKARFFEWAPGISVSDLQAYSAARQYEVVFIDYLQLMSSYGSNRYEMATNISRDLHRFSQSTGTTVVALSQLSRNGGEYGKKSDPDMSSLRESGQIEQDADAVLLMYLDDENQPDGFRILKCAKNKDGKQFRIPLDFDGKYQRFSKSETYAAIKKEQARIAFEEKQRKKEEERIRKLPKSTPVPFEPDKRLPDPPKPDPLETVGGIL